ncbi:hypothetical protein BDQ17DRAFT_1432027 [Cyathus striatus]|nr:hypothetical protein BDQ17DRAFT_1432027 [Cyathus striatus]
MFKSIPILTMRLSNPLKRHYRILSAGADSNGRSTRWPRRSQLKTEPTKTLPHLQLGGENHFSDNFSNDFRNYMTKDQHHSPISKANLNASTRALCGNQEDSVEDTSDNRDMKTIDDESVNRYTKTSYASESEDDDDNVYFTAPSSPSNYSFAGRDTSVLDTCYVDAKSEKSNNSNINNIASVEESTNTNASSPSFEPLVPKKSFFATKLRLCLFTAKEKSPHADPARRYKQTKIQLLRGWASNRLCRFKRH